MNPSIHPFRKNKESMATIYSSTQSLMYSDAYVDELNKLISEINKIPNLTQQQADLITKLGYHARVIHMRLLDDNAEKQNLHYRFAYENICKSCVRIERTERRLGRCYTEYGITFITTKLLTDREIAIIGIYNGGGNCGNNFNKKNEQFTEPDGSVFYRTTHLCEVDSSD